MLAWAGHGNGSGNGGQPAGGNGKNDGGTLDWAPRDLPTPAIRCGRLRAVYQGDASGWTDAAAGLSSLAQFESGSCLDTAAYEFVASFVAFHAQNPAAHRPAGWPAGSSSRWGGTDVYSQSDLSIGAPGVIATRLGTEASPSTRTRGCACWCSAGAAFPPSGGVNAQARHRRRAAGQRRHQD